MCHMSCVNCLMSCVIRHLSPVTCHLTTTKCSFSCYESPRMLGDAAEGGLVIDKVLIKNYFFVNEKKG